MTILNLAKSRTSPGLRWANCLTEHVCDSVVILISTAVRFVYYLYTCLKVSFMCFCVCLERCYLLCVKKSNKDMSLWLCIREIFFNGSLVCFCQISWLFMFKSLVRNVVQYHLGRLCMDANGHNESNLKRTRTEQRAATDMAFIMNLKLVWGENVWCHSLPSGMIGCPPNAPSPWSLFSMHLPISHLGSCFSQVRLSLRTTKCIPVKGSGQTNHRQIRSRLAGRARPLGFSRIQLRSG